MKVPPKSAIHLGPVGFSVNELEAARRRKICILLNRVLAVTVDTNRWVERTYWRAQGPAAAELRTQLVFAHVQLKRQGHVIAERALSLRRLFGNYSPRREHWLGRAPTGALSVEGHVREIKARLGLLASEIRIAAEACAQLKDGSLAEALKEYFAVAHEIRSRIETKVPSQVGAANRL
jgi:hypothetical protein